MTHHQCMGASLQILFHSLYACGCDVAYIYRLYRRNAYIYNYYAGFKWELCTLPNEFSFLHGGIITRVQWPGVEAI